METVSAETRAAVVAVSMCCMVCFAVLCLYTVCFFKTWLHFLGGAPKAFKITHSFAPLLRANAPISPHGRRPEL